MNNLTKKQDEILDLIKRFIAEHGYPPTVREICKEKNSTWREDCDSRQSSINDVLAHF